MSNHHLVESDTYRNTNTYECSKLANKISTNLQTFFENREFFDVLLKANDSLQMRSHRIVLCASSEYFLVKFRSMPKTSKPMEIEVEEFNSVILKSILQFMYTGSVDFCIETIKEVIRAADHFKMESLKNLGYIFMSQELNSGNCLNTVMFAIENDFSELYEQSFSFAYKHFEKICSGDDFLKLDGDMLADVISKDELGVSSEKKIVTSLLTWLEHDRQNRVKSWLSLLSKVRYQFLTYKFIMKNTSSLCINLECHELVSSWLEWHLLPEKRSKCLSILVRPRKAYRTEKSALISGRYTSELVIQTFYPKFNAWAYEILPTVDHERQKFSAKVKKGVAIIAGGIGRDDIRTNKVECFKSTIEFNGVLLQLPSMRLPRSSPGIALIKGQLFIVGGIGVELNECHHLVSVERFTFSTKTWQEVYPLLRPIHNVQVEVLNGLLYAVGANSMQCYNPTENFWVNRTPKTEKSDFFGLVAVGGYLFTVGGRLANGMKSATVERYNPLSNLWQVISSLKSPREQPKCLAFHNSFVVIGGFCRWEWLNTVEEYNIESNKWKTLAPVVDVAPTKSFAIDLQEQQY